MAIESLASQRTAHAATQTLGLALIASAYMVVVVVTLLVLGGEDIALFALGAVVTIAATVVTWRVDRQWARAVGLAATVASLMTFFIGLGVVHVFSPLESVVGLAYVMGVSVSLVAGIRALVAGHHHATEEPTANLRTRVFVFGVLGVAAVTSVTGYLLTRESVAAEDAAGAAVVEMSRFAFSPETIVVQPGGAILLENKDPFTHDFTLEAFDIDVVVGPGNEAIVDLADVPPGTYSYICTLHSSGGTGMVGTLEVGTG